MVYVKALSWSLRRRSLREMRPLIQATCSDTTASPFSFDCIQRYYIKGVNCCLKVCDDFEEAALSLVGAASAMQTHSSACCCSSSAPRPAGLCLLGLRRLFHVHRAGRLLQVRELLDCSAEITGECKGFSGACGAVAKVQHVPLLSSDTFSYRALDNVAPAPATLRLPFPVGDLAAQFSAVPLEGKEIKTLADFSCTEFPSGVRPHSAHTATWMKPASGVALVSGQWSSSIGPLGFLRLGDDIASVYRCAPSQDTYPVHRFLVGLIMASIAFAVRWIACRLLEHGYDSGSQDLCVVCEIRFVYVRVPASFISFAFFDRQYV